MDKLDDLLNPIVVKELRQAVKSRIVMVALVLFLILQLAILLLHLSLDDPRRLDGTSLHLGRSIFQILQGILLGTCMLLIPAYAGVRLASEHSDTNVDLLFISTLRPRGIIAGKLQASIVLILLIFSACAPFMTFTYLLRGIDIPSILLVLVVDFLVVLLGTQVAIFLGTVPANAGLKLLLGLFGLGSLCTLFGYGMATSVVLLDEGLGSRMDTLDFWLVAGALVLAVVAVIGLLFMWSVAIVSPPSLNRALPVRLYLLGFWLVTGGVAALLALLLPSTHSALSVDGHADDTALRSDSDVDQRARTVGLARPADDFAALVAALAAVSALQWLGRRRVVLRAAALPDHRTAQSRPGTLERFLRHGIRPLIPQIHS